ncbi:MAG: hypothetical protein HYW48_10455 [Deltaproteobacteria bacterium]|nr:hypothetical protein [Deltaproteobacteria bacterium]
MYVKEYNIAAEARKGVPHESSGKNILGSFAAFAAVATAGVVISQAAQEASNEGLSLVADSTLDECFAVEQKRFWAASETPMNHLQAYNFMQRALRFFLQPASAAATP